jgi:hypothetical protein
MKTANATATANATVDQHHKTAAADLIRSIDTAFAKVSSSSANAARDAKEARKNARIASELARKYRARSSPRDSSIFTFSNGGEGQYALNDNGNGNSESPDSQKKRKNPTAALSPADRRLADSNAAAVLTLTLEVERVQRSLESETMAHDETKAAFQQQRARNAQLEAQIEKLLNDMETARELSGRTVDDMEQELCRAQLRVDMAEEDAQLALDLAKDSSQSRDTMEEWLEKALHQVLQVREQAAAATATATAAPWPVVDASTPKLEHEREQPSPASASVQSKTKATKHAVRFAETPTVFSGIPGTPASSLTASPSSRPARSMVFAGRQLLQRSIESSASHRSDDSTYSVSVSSSNSAERRRRLRERLKASEAQSDHIMNKAFPKHSGQQQAQSMELVKSCRNAARILKESGERLSLSGRWWNETPDGSNAGGASEAEGAHHLETLARHYCTSVEVSQGLLDAWIVYCLFFLVGSLHSLVLFAPFLALLGTAGT